MPDMRDVAIGDDTIRLGQLMKLANVADSGGDAKSLLAAGEVRVNGEVETRRGRQLRRGDEVVLLGQHLRVVGKA
jgi:ribosome-associated protein